MLILGIDPGTAVTGYGVVRAGPTPTLVECGVIRTKADWPLPRRLRDISEGVRELLARHRPQAMAVESAFYAKNVRTTLVLGHARGVILLAGEEAGVEIHEYPPAEIKKAVVGAGAATKTQVQLMVAQLLRLKTAPQPSDAADGVAAALTCAMRLGAQRALHGARGIGPLLRTPAAREAQVIARLDGTLVAHGLDRIELRTGGGVTYEVMVPLGVLETLPAAGGAMSLHTAMVVREDAWTLYGFATAEERKLFQRLMGTTGVGPALAMNLLSTLTGERLVRAVREGDLATLTQVPRVGKKLAERLVLELRDKLEGAGEAIGGGKAAPAGGASGDAVRALVALGYQTADAERAVRAALEGAPKGETTADLVRRSLAALAK